MAERDVTRNGRGQIVSYEIDGASDSTQDTLQYGKVFLPTFENGATKVEKLKASSFLNVTPSTFSNELIVDDRQVDAQILLNEVLTDSDYEVSDDTSDDDQNDSQGTNEQGNN